MAAKIKSYMMTNIVAFIAIFIAIITMFIIKPNRNYLNYFDYRTLTSLFISLAVICALKNITSFKSFPGKLFIYLNQLELQSSL